MKGSEIKMAAYLKYLDDPDYPEDIVAMAHEILTLRRMLWLRHGHTGMYGDDGEMQCGECAHEYGFWDWKRTPLDEIESKILAANLKKLANAKEKP